MPAHPHHLAAPLILVIGCSAPPSDLPPTAPTISNQEVATIAPDAGVPADAAPPRPPLDAGPPPSAGQVVSIINWSRDGDRTWITINRGTDNGLANGTQGVLVGADGAAVPASSFVLERCTARTCKAQVDLPLDAVMEAKKVQLP